MLRPVIEATATNRIIEIGADQGTNSERIARWCARHDAYVDIIDPLPAFDVAAFEARFAGSATVHQARSLDIVGSLLPADVILIDGDHNWYTVFHELTTIYGPAGGSPTSDAIVICHDVIWPFGRRDAYYDVESIPVADRHPNAPGVPVPHQAHLAPPILGTLHSALTEGGPRNGVRTAIEDALAGREDQFRIVTLDVLDGLAIIVPVQRLAASPPLGALLDHLELPAPWRDLVRLIEEGRRIGNSALHRQALLAGMRIVQPSTTRPFYSLVPPGLALTLFGPGSARRHEGRAMLLNPVDQALYERLFETLRPRTVFEIGLAEGGRSKWMADLMRKLDIDGRIIGVDIDPPAIDDPLITLRRGDARSLGDVFEDEFVSRQPRPLLLIEDLAHDPATCTAVLNFFDPNLISGDYVVIEDGLAISALQPPGLDGLVGPSAAISEFLSRRGKDYAIDTEICDLFGYNVTANPNGWLKRI